MSNEEKYFYGDPDSSYTADAYYRLPHTSEIVWVRGDAEALSSAKELSGRQGFVVAPFHATDYQPLLLISPQYVETRPLPPVQLKDATYLNSGMPYYNDSRSSYSKAFNTFHQALTTNQFHKLVLARQMWRMRMMSEGTAFHFFLTACHLYPRMFVSLFYTRESGEWLIITPEVMLQNHGDGLWRTSAVAGTMRLTPNAPEGAEQQLQWTAKDMKEQRIVAAYVGDTLQSLGIDFQEEGPHAIRAGHLAHLRSDFTFRLDTEQHPPIGAREGDVLQALHPTPAVCGLPKEEALRFILDNEPDSRGYYSGYAGPLNLAIPSPTAQMPNSPSAQLPGSQAQMPQSPLTTHLYVSLRCLEDKASTYTLYAGGGLLPESDEQKEWEETEAKMETMKRCIAASKM